MSRSTRILVVDDHPIVREGLAEALQRERGWVVCAQAEDRRGALEAIERTRPDLAVIDLALKQSSGLDLIKDIRARWPQLLILVVSMHDEALYAERVLRAGAQGYITKQQATRDVLGAVRRVLSGGIYVNERMASTILGRLARPSSRMADTIAGQLTDRELQVFDLTGRGLSTRSIACQLGIDMKTVETYRGRIRDKLGLKAPDELLPLAIRWVQERGHAADTAAGAGGSPPDSGRGAPRDAGNQIRTDDGA